MAPAPDPLDLFLDLGAIVIAALALGVSVLSWRVAQQATRATQQGARAAIYDRRFEIYSDAEDFIAAWSRDGRPDIRNALPTLVGAWSRSHFLCRDEVTRYLRQLWLDAVQADYLNNVISGEVKGDRDAAIAKAHDYLNEHVDFEKLRELFSEDLKI